MTANPENQGLYDKQFEHDACGIGAVVDIAGRPNHAILEYGQQVLKNLRHRGAAGADNVTGDGAGILLQIPHELFAGECQKNGIVLPAPGRYGVGMVFTSKDALLRAKWDALLAQAMGHYGLDVIGWREVPTQPDCLGPIALAAEPAIRQVFIDGNGLADADLERRLYLARKRTERLVREDAGAGTEEFYVVSMSCRTICYKGMFMDWQLFTYYPDLEDKRTTTSLCIIHQRYSTNTFPNWRLAQPFRCIAHNGEINTLSGNRNSMRGREPKMVSPTLGDDLTDVFPVVDPTGSDSAAFDNALELLVQSGRSMPHALMMMIPEAFGAKYHISTDKRAFYEYHAAVMEPWDGPAAMVFTDGRIIGGTLDRNGLRPCRYVVTKDGLAIIGSEAGVVEFPPEQISAKGRLRPGHLFLIDTTEGRIISDNEIKSKIARQSPYRRWLEENRIELRGLFDAPDLVETDPVETIQRMRAFGYTAEEKRMVLAPMAVNGQEPVGSMGNDTPLAVLSDRSKLLFSYFRQLFAQVTNPAIDPLREGLVMSLMLFTGKKRNVLDESPLHCRQLKLPHPILTSADMARLRAVSRADFKVATVPMLFDVNRRSPGKALRKGLDALVKAAQTAVADGASLVILSDRGVSQTQAAIPSLLAVSAVHHHLLREGLRNECGLIVESAEPREVMHFCLLAGYGANAVNPYLAFDVLAEMNQSGDLGEAIEPVAVSDHYIAAIKKGILKTMSKMGISTLRSYMYAQLFEAIGLKKSFVDEYFTGTTSRIGGIGLDEIARETLSRHAYAYDNDDYSYPEIDMGGDYQEAVRNNDARAYAAFAEAVNAQSERLCTLRGLFEFQAGKPVPIEKVEPADEIVKRFCTGAMSHGSISKEAHECMAVAMNRLGGMSNTGEGGEDPARYVAEPNGDSKNSAIKQVASARFGVTINYLAHARELQIKIAQGAKPGEGGQLPGHKVNDEIARVRHSTPGVTLISPPPHHDIYSIEDLAQLIFDLKNANPQGRIHVKLVAEAGVGTVAAGVSKAHADVVLISGHDGGTGASPLTSLKHAGGPWELGLAETQQTLLLNGLRDRIRVQCDGQLKTGRDVVIAALLGAEEFGFATAPLVVEGCIMMRVCHLDTCPVGIATQNPELRKKYTGQADHVVNFFTFLAQEVREYLAELGFRSIDEAVGQAHVLRQRDDAAFTSAHPRAAALDLSPIFEVPESPFFRHQNQRQTKTQEHGLEGILDERIIRDTQLTIDAAAAASSSNAPAWMASSPVPQVHLSYPVRNVDRTVGTMTGSRITRAAGAEGLPDGTIAVTLTGSAGNSFGAFIPRGLTLDLVGDANDFVGKGLSGGRIIVRPHGTAPEQISADNPDIIAGNVIGFGATSGDIFIAGAVGERFCVRNSGATAVVEGIGNHGCEYMTGGRVVVLGEVGDNFGAGMSGGVAYLAPVGDLERRINGEMVDVEKLEAEDIEFLESIIDEHIRLTGSTTTWQARDMVKVMPRDYKKVLGIIDLASQEGRDINTAIMEAVN